MNDNPLLSIVVPAYNVDKWLARCVESIIKQTYQNLEIILVDDGSTDNTGLIIDEYCKKDKRIKAFHKTNEGVTKARKFALEKATGEYIGFVDSDDYIDEDMYEVLLENIMKYDADISHCGYQMEFDDGRIIKFYDSNKVIVQNNYEGQKDLLLGEFVEPGLWNKLYKKSLFDKLEYDENIRINEDLMINFLLFQKSQKSVFYDVCKYHYMIRNDSASRSYLNKNKIYDPIKVKEFIKEVADHHVKDIANRAYLSTCINVYNAIVVSNNKIFEEDRKLIRRLIINYSNLMHFLTKKQRILFFMIVHTPNLYPVIYRLYEAHFQHKKYD